MSALVVDELSDRLDKYWSRKTKEVKPAVKIVVCSLRGMTMYLPVFKEDSSFVYMASDYVYVVVKSKLNLSKTEKKTLYYEVVPSEQDLMINKYPVRPISCPKDISDLGLLELSSFKIVPKGI